MKVGGISQNAYIGNQGAQTQERPVHNPNIQPKHFASPQDKLNMLKDMVGEKELYRLGVIQCESCENRRYQDGSNDPGVSFKAPGKIDPVESAAVVMSHEMEHVSNERAKAEAEDRQVISQSVQLFTSVCNECGRAYVSGGETKTVTGSKPDNDFLGIDEDLLKGLYVDERK